MSNINYELEIIGEKITYNPRKEFIDPIVKSKNKIFEITSDNSYGKTFILNLIAYALEVDKLSEDKILKTIRERIKGYDDTSSYNLEYDIELDLPDNKKLSLSKEKGGNKLIKINDSPPISHNVLHKNLSVIYDVPTNPSDRLNAVIKDLDSWNNQLREKISRKLKYFNDISKEFDSVRDEEKIKKLVEKEISLVNKIKVSQSEVKEKENLILELNKIKNLDNLGLQLQKKLEYQSKIFKKSKKFKLLKKPSKIDKKDENKIQLLNEESVSFENSFKRIISKLIEEINNDVELKDQIEENNLKNYTLIKETELIDIFKSDNYDEKLKELINSIEYIKDTIIRFIQEKSNDESYIIHNSYQQFVNALKELMENKIDHLLKPATSIDSNKLIKHLESIIDEHEIKNYDSLRRFLRDDLKLVKGYAVQFIRVQNKLIQENKKKLVNDDESLYYSLSAELKILNEKLKILEQTLNKSIVKSSNELKIDDLTYFDTIDKVSDLKYGIKLNFSDKSKLKNLNQSIYNLEREKAISTKKLDEQEISKRMNGISLEREKNKKNSKYNDAEKLKITKFIKSLLIVNANLYGFNQVISKMESGLLTRIESSEDIQFVELAGKIIAYSMDNKLLRVDGEFVELYFYDMVKQNFHCEGDLIIKKDDVSTGLASANYLKQRIDNVDGDYVVILLDEIGNMAQKAINTVVESIKKLEKQNRLVLAILTRPIPDGIKFIE